MAEMQSILKRKAEKLDDLIIAYSTEMKCFVCRLLAHISSSIYKTNDILMLDIFQPMTRGQVREWK